MHVLLVEDNRADALLLREFFSEQPNSLDIEWVTDGYKALDYVFKRGEFSNAKRPDVILLDLGLPRISGYEVLKELKNDPRYAGIPVVVLTTSRNPLDLTQCQQFGADSFLSKPYNLKGYEYLVHQLVDTEFPRLAAAG